VSFIAVVHAVDLAERLEHSNGARDQQYDDTQRYENLYHSKQLCPASEKRCIGWSEGRALRKGDKKVIDKTWPPVFDAKSLPFGIFDLHLGEDETAATECRMLLAHGRTAAVEAPIPERKDEHIREPKLRPRE
jgi:hypothetical protein